MKMANRVRQIMGIMSESNTKNDNQILFGNRIFNRNPKAIRGVAKPLIIYKQFSMNDNQYVNKIDVSIRDLEKAKAIAYDALLDGIFDRKTVHLIDRAMMVIEGEIYMIKNSIDDLRRKEEKEKRDEKKKL